ncbi:hypothetical protein F4808DRAFT_463216 [Astrocystis sublimbata]|nr:hypothetical protein F4808DRAFT_463216 [Astrocystis sublimbata]
MAARILIPYDPSMRLGEGYNSFLHEPCVYGAIEISNFEFFTHDKEPTMREAGKVELAQTVERSVRSVEKMSQVVECLGLSAARSIKAGMVGGLGYDGGVDGDGDGVPPNASQMNSRKFFEVYGDSYISGFIHGGDFHSVISMKGLDAPTKAEIESLIQEMLHDPQAPEPFSREEHPNITRLNALLEDKGVGPTITVTYSGGGQLKPESEIWTLARVLRAAKSFPARVAECPQRTHAVLTRWDRNPSFVAWAVENGIVVPDFGPGSLVYGLVGRLLDDFFELKRILKYLMQVMAEPEDYEVASCDSEGSEDPVKLSIQALMKERTMMRGEMGKIVRVVDLVNEDPIRSLNGDNIDREIEELKDLGLWRRRLPVLKSHDKMEQPVVEPTDVPLLLDR